MDDGLKQRLVGAIVLVALAVIFIPMIFDDAKLEPEDIRVTIPPRPAMPPVKITQPEPPAVRPQETVVAAEDAPSTGEAQLPQQLPESWVLQVASFKERENADALRDRLRKEDYKAYVRFRPHKEPALARVFVGPELDRRVVERYKEELQQKFKLDGIVVQFMQDDES